FTRLNKRNEKNTCTKKYATSSQQTKNYRISQQNETYNLTNWLAKTAKTTKITRKKMRGDHAPFPPSLGIWSNKPPTVLAPPVLLPPVARNIPTKGSQQIGP